MSGDEYTVEQFVPECVDAGLREEWTRLSQIAWEPNIYLTPEFVLPACELLSVDQPSIVTIRQERRSKLVGLCALQKRAFGKGPIKFPIDALFQSKHSFSSGFLVDPEHAEGVTRELASYLAACRKSLWYSSVSRSSVQFSSLLAAARDSGADVYEHHAFERACLPGLENGRLRFCALSSRRRKDLRRKKKNLQKVGDVKWRYLCGSDVSEAVIRRFLQLEHMGWKGKEKTSLLSNPREAEFFRKVVSGLIKRCAVCFAEIRLDDEVISSACNFQVSGHAFCFKIGWNPEFADYSPGILNEYEFVRAIQSGQIEYVFVDSGTSGRSYLNDLWAGTTTMVSGLLAFGVVPKTALLGLRLARAIRGS